MHLLPWQVRAQQAEWAAAGVDHDSSCRDFMQQLAYREYSRWGLQAAFNSPKVIGWVACGHY